MKEQTINKLEQDKLELSLEQEPDDIEPSQSVQPSVQVNPAATSSEIIMISTNTIHMGSSYLSVDVIADVLVKLLQDKQVQQIINPQNKSDNKSYTN